MLSTNANLGTVGSSKQQKKVKKGNTQESLINTTGGTLFQNFLYLPSISYRYAEIVTKPTFW
jgi:hypothetical protein